MGARLPDDADRLLMFWDNVFADPDPVLDQ